MAKRGIFWFCYSPGDVFVHVQWRFQRFSVSAFQLLVQSPSMKCFVTGASGFIGANLVHELIARGHEVRALLRRASDTRGLAGLGYERIEGDVNDRDSLIRGLDGCDWCFHVA